MNDGYLDRAYGLEPGTSTEAFYDDWAGSYDAEIENNGYATPARCAAALAAAGVDKGAPVLDFGCGTGLAGLALKAEGFEAIDGWDVSEGMLDKARGKGCYRAFTRLEVDAPPPEPDPPYAGVVAAGVIGIGAAPPEAFDTMMGALASGGIAVLSLNDHALADPVFEGRILEWIDCGAAELLEKAYGEHLPGIDLKAMVYTLRKR
jgi:predicted TPR repeat methyltransferase